MGRLCAISLGMDLFGFCLLRGFRQDQSGSNRKHQGFQKNLGPRQSGIPEERAQGKQDSRREGPRQAGIPEERVQGKQEPKQANLDGNQMSIN